VSERNPRIVLTAGAILGLLFLAYLAYSRPGYFTRPIFIGGFLLVECLIAAVWNYRRGFFPLVLLTFLFAGVGLPGGWTMARWFFLGAGALVGSFVMLKERSHRFGLFHLLAAFAVLAALVSAAVSHYPEIAMLKAVSLLLLFVYAGTGARLAVRSRENQFFAGLLLGCEGFIVALAVLYFLGIEIMGNPNSLGAVSGVAAPILLWGILIEENPFIRRRRWVLYALCMYLTFHSQARASLAAAFLSCGLLCVILRKYKMLAQGLAIFLIFLVLAASSAIVDPFGFSRRTSAFTASVVYKGKDPSLGVLGSRMSPWQTAMDILQTHFWFGTGFGTSDSGRDASDHFGKFSSTAEMAVENGSSYLAIVTWVGVAGVAPFVLLLLVLIGKVIRTLVWVRKTGNAYHPALPLAMIVLAGLLHAAFEDWLFAVGYYLCIFFWTLAFVFVDLAPARPLAAFAVWRPPLIQGNVDGIVPSR